MLPDFQGQVRRYLQSLGFHRVGFAKPSLGQAAVRFQQWIQNGYHGEMQYLPRRLKERTDPTQILPTLRSVIVAGFPYDHRLQNTHDPSEGNISRYAWGQDYHQILDDKLREFSKWFTANGAKLYHSIDSSPVMEKAWAAQAGLGWIGKHTNVIDPQSGSYFFLAVLLTDIEFIPDAPAVDHCGTCSKCITACPTGAIIAPYVLDARLCISYLTIELKGPIPRHLRPLLGNHIFGCDDCQEVCPWNRFSQPTKEGSFFPRQEVIHRPLREFLNLSEEEFRRRFTGSAILRAKRRGFVRNVLIAIGNSGDLSFVLDVHDKLTDSDPLVRGHAVWAYHRLLGQSAKQVLLERLQIEIDHWVREEIEAALAEI